MHAPAGTLAVFSLFATLFVLGFSASVAHGQAEVSPPPSPPSVPAGGVAGAPQACAVAGIKHVVAGVAGFSVSADDSKVLFNRPLNGVTQVFLLDRQSGTQRCLTCEATGGIPAASLHKGSPSFLPDDKHFLLQVEMAHHPFEGKMGAPGTGWFNDVWLGAIDNDRWTNLTHYPSGPKDRYGALSPEASPDGERVAWAELYGGGSAEARSKSEPRDRLLTAPWGEWRIQVANLEMPGEGEGDAKGDGEPELGERETVTLPHATWYETQGWSRDGHSLIFASDSGKNTPQAMDLWMHDFLDGRNTNLTNSEDHGEEFGDIAPSGKLIAFMSSECCNYRPDQSKERMRSELYLTPLDRKWTARLTHYNEPGSADATAATAAGGSVVSKLRWSHDGSKIYFERPFYGAGGKAMGGYVEELTFAGACGGAVD